MKNAYTIIAIPVSIARAIIGIALMTPIVAVCALLDKLSAMLLTKGGYDYEFLESVREGCCMDLTSFYYNLSSFK